METRTLTIIASLVLVVSVVGVLVVPGLLGGQYSLLGISEVEVEQQGYVGTDGEWKGSYWVCLLTTDFDDQISGFHLADNEDGIPSETYAESLSSGQTQVSSYVVDGNELKPTADVMVHITPGQPYYERDLEIQQGYYVKEASSRGQSDYGYWENFPSAPTVSAVAFNHYCFGTGSWVLHTPFTVNVYKDGAYVGGQTIDTVGGTGTYTIQTNVPGETVVVQNLGKLLSGYGEPQWDDVLYFDKNNIFVRSYSADEMLEYDNGETAYAVPGASIGFLSSSVNSFSTNWYGTARWMNDDTPTVTSLSGLPEGWKVEGSKAVPVRPDYTDVTEYLEDRGVQKVVMPTGFDRLEKTSDNKLRVYMTYGSYSNLVTVKISTELADTIVHNPQVGNFEITSFSDFGDVVDSKSCSLTVKCTAGAGSAQIQFTKSPSDLELSISPTQGTPYMETGDSYTINFNVLNLGTSSDRTFTITAKVFNSIGDFVDSDTASGTLKTKTGETTILHVYAKHDGDLVNDIPVAIEFLDESNFGRTGDDGNGLISFNLETSSTVSVDVSFSGNNVYRPSSETVSVTGGSEKSVTLDLYLWDEEEPIDWTLYIIIGLAVAVAVVAVVAVYAWRR